MKKILYVLMILTMMSGVDASEADKDDSLCDKSVSPTFPPAPPPSLSPSPVPGIEVGELENHASCEVDS